ncbi:hypothetical protein AXX17_AT1G09040 [Arabidopsis thaliana]|uniref:Uncharacterized protein n=1 Tax=Arabidopsis thaliana TaxID=3702 RepID=A0A178WN56_ARATH|nr:hypothetical protein AXX17_AT1G09040 [Arabidopsis thaliana]
MRIKGFNRPGFTHLVLQSCVDDLDSKATVSTSAYNPNAHIQWEKLTWSQI